MPEPGTQRQVPLSFGRLAAYSGRSLAIDVRPQPLQNGRQTAYNNCRYGADQPFPKTSSGRVPTRGV